jgi:hypothetical protein
MNRLIVDHPQSRQVSQNVVILEGFVALDLGDEIGKHNGVLSTGGPELSLQNRR